MSSRASTTFCHNTIRVLPQSLGTLIGLESVASKSGGCKNEGSHDMNYLQKAKTVLPSASSTRTKMIRRLVPGAVLVAILCPPILGTAGTSPITAQSDSSALAQESRCETAKAYFKAIESSDCTCGVKLRNLKVTLPAGMKLLAACSLRWPNGSSIDLSTDVISMDEYTHGNYPDGELYLAGVRELTGTVVVEEEPSGRDLRFNPEWDFPKNSSVFLRELRRGFSLEERDRTTFRVEDVLKVRTCSIAGARIRIRGLRVLFGSTDEAGTYPLSVRIRETTPYRECRAK
jgi:hypothetical protein